MTAAIICRYILESRAADKKRRLLVCGPTNKSVVVLAMKALAYMREDDSINAVLIGDREELMSDNPDELETFFVYAYTTNLIRRWKTIKNKLLKRYDIDQVEDEFRDVMSDMRRRIPTISRHLIEIAFENVQDCFESFDDAREEVWRLKLEEADSDAKVGNQEKRESPIEEKKAKRELELALAMVTREFQSLDEQEVVQDLLRSADVIFCTMSTAGNMNMRRTGQVNDLIVDEAAACTEAEILIPLHMKPERLLLVGDPKQLPATVQSPQAIKFGFAQSLQERLMYKNSFDYTILNVQYRMRPEISQWPVAEFYNSQVQDGVNVQEKTYQSDVSLSTGDPYIWVQVTGKEQKDKNMSTFNESEGEAIVALLLDMVDKYNLELGYFTPDRVRIITFYKAQQDYLRFKLKQYNLNVMVSTVDASQGCEADIIVVSFVRGTSGHMGFIKHIQRLNVAMTRAKFQLVCVGNLDSIAGLAERGGNLVLRRMAQDALARGQIVEPLPLPPPPKRARQKKSAPGIRNLPLRERKKKSKKPKKHLPCSKSR